MKPDPAATATAAPESKPRPLGQRLLRAARSLRAAVLLIVAIGVIVPAGVATYDESNTLRAEFDMRLHDDIGQIATLLARALRDPMWQLANDQANSLIEAALIDPRIVSVQVFDYRQRLFAQRERPPLGDEPSIVHTRPIFKDGEALGIVLVEMSTHGYTAQLSELIARGTRRTGIILLGSLLLIAVVLHFRLGRPLDRLAAEADHLARGDLSTPIGTRRQDEIGQLANGMEVTRQALAGLIATLEQKNTQLREANEHLEARVTQRTLQLEEAIATLKRAQTDIIEAEKLASLGRIVAGVAHELNTPIGNALTVASTLADSFTPLREEFLAGSVRKTTLSAAIERSADGFDILLRNLEKTAQLIRDFKQVAVDQTSEQRRSFDLAHVTAEVLATLQPTLKKTPFRIVTDLPSGIACNSYPGPYGQVLSNLVMNAVTHAFDGRPNGTITVRIDSPSEGMVRLIVADDGVGMTESIRRRVFDPFFTTRLGRGGSGLGMNIVLSIVVRLLGGAITLDSHPGTGTVVTVEMPAMAPDSGAPTPLS